MPVQLFLLFIMLYTVLSVPTAYFTQPSSSSVSSSPSSSLTDTQHGQNSQANQQKYVIKTITSVPLYRIVSYFTNRTEETETKVHDLGIPHTMYYTHIYFAWKSADQIMSSITLEAGSPNSTLNGANLVLSTPKLGDMYAPGLITNVLDFVTKCYDWAKPTALSIPISTAFVSTLRVAASDEVNQALIKYTAEQFLRATVPGSYHFVWERDATMKDFMTKLGYEQVACGGSEQSPSPCDWTLMGLTTEKAREQCIYRLINTKSSEDGLQIR